MVVGPHAGCVGGADGEPVLAAGQVQIVGGVVAVRIVPVVVHAFEAVGVDYVVGAGEVERGERDGDVALRAVEADGVGTVDARHFGCVEHGLLTRAHVHRREGDWRLVGALGQHVGGDDDEAVGRAAHEVSAPHGGPRLGIAEGGVEGLAAIYLEVGIVHVAELMLGQHPHRTVGPGNHRLHHVAAIVDAGVMQGDGGRGVGGQVGAAERRQPAAEHRHADHAVGRAQGLHHVGRHVGRQQFDAAETDVRRVGVAEVEGQQPVPGRHQHAPAHLFEAAHFQIVVLRISGQLVVDVDERGIAVDVAAHEVEAAVERADPCGAVVGVKHRVDCVAADAVFVAALAAIVGNGVGVAAPPQHEEPAVTAARPHVAIGVLGQAVDVGPELGRSRAQRALPADVERARTGIVVDAQRAVLGAHPQAVVAVHHQAAHLALGHLRAGRGRQLVVGAIGHHVQQFALHRVYPQVALAVGIADVHRLLEHLTRLARGHVHLKQLAVGLIDPAYAAHPAHNLVFGPASAGIGHHRDVDPEGDARGRVVAEELEGAVLHPHTALVVDVYRGYGDARPLRRQRHCGRGVGGHVVGQQTAAGAPHQQTARGGAAQRRDVGVDAVDGHVIDGAGGGVVAAHAPGRRGQPDVAAAHRLVGEHGHVFEMLAAHYAGSPAREHPGVAVGVVGNLVDGGAAQFALAARLGRHPAAQCRRGPHHTAVFHRQPHARARQRPEVHHPAGAAHGVGDVHEALGGGAEQIDLTVVGEAPEVAHRVGHHGVYAVAAHPDAVGGQSAVVPELAAVPAAQSVPRAEPHEAAAVLKHAEHHVLRQPVVHGVAFHVRAYLRRCPEPDQQSGQHRHAYLSCLMCHIPIYDLEKRHSCRADRPR